MRIVDRLHRDESGAILILFAVCTMAFVLMVAFVVDIANWLEHRRHLKVQVDAGVLATGADFNFCVAAPDQANAAIAAAARQHAGDPAVPGSFNQQIGDPSRVELVLNAVNYPPDGVDAFTPPLDRDRMPCALRSLEIKAKDNGVPSILSSVVPFLDIRARAKVEIRKLDEIKGMLPWAMPEYDPRAIGVLFVDEATGNVVGRNLLLKDTTQTYTKNGTAVRMWHAYVRTDVVTRTGVVIIESDVLNPSLAGDTVAQICANPNVRCRAGSTQTSGLGFVRGYSTSGTGAPAAPILREVYLQNLDCFSDGSPPAGSAPYYLRAANCHVRVRANVDFGQGAGDPTNTPIDARLWVQGLGCPTSGSSNGCPMPWNADDGYFETDAMPFIARGSGRNSVSLHWESGGVVSPLAAVRRAARPEPVRTLAGPAPSTRRITITKTVSGGSAAPSDWTIEVRNADGTVVDSAPGSATGRTTGPLPSGVYTVRELPTTASAQAYTLSFPRQGGNDCNAVAGSVDMGTATISNQDVECNLRNTFVVPPPPDPTAGTFTNVLNPYATNTASGPVDFLQITKLGVGDTGSLPLGAEQDVHVYVGVRPALQVAQAGDPPILLRVASESGSQNQALNCDRDQTFDKEIENGCSTPYQVNPTDDCSDYDNNELPPDPDTIPPNPAPDCVAVETGDRLGLLRTGLEARFETPRCHPNQWPDDPQIDPLPGPGDPRWVVLVVTNDMAFTGSGSDDVPVRKLGGFYVTGWDVGGQTKGCLDNDPPPGLSDHGDVWGYFVTTINFVPGATESSELCNFGELGICMAVLTE
jgi:hypothetical protein